MEREFYLYLEFKFKIRNLSCKKIKIKLILEGDEGMILEVLLF